MTLEIQPTPIAPGTWTPAADRGVTVAPTLRAAFTAQKRGAENLERLLAEGALCVTSGQQPGLFTGPLFTLYKALSAVTLARACEAALGRPVVPGFWVAGDDHDFAEANHVAVLTGGNAVERLALAPRDQDAPSTPLYQEPLGPQVETLIAALAAHTADTNFRGDAMDWLARHYRPDNDMAAAFGESLAELLGESGLIVFAPTHAAAKAAAAPWIIKALEHAADLDTALQARAAELVQAGPVQVSIQPGNTLVMLDGERGRDRLVIDGSAFRTRRSGESLTLEQLREIAATTPERLSANVLLRPVVEAAILPTVGSVGGPGEMAYFPQTTPVYEILGVIPQGIVPRWSARMIEARTRKTLDRYALAPEDLGSADGQLETRLVGDALPDRAAQALQRMRAVLGEEFPPLVEASKKIDVTLEKPVEKARNQIDATIDHAEKRIIARLKDHNETLLRQIAAARNATFPEHKPQERVFNIVQYLVKYGPDLLQDLERECGAWAKTIVHA